MRKRLLIAISGISLLLLSGCFRVYRTIHVEKDGSGKLIQKVLIQEGLMEGMGGGSSNHDPEKLKRDAVKLGEGVKYVSSREISEDEMSGYEAIYSFADITKLKLDEDPAAGLMDMGFGNSNKEYITFLFQKGKTAELQVIKPHNEEIEEEYLPEESDDQISEEDVDQAWEMTREIYAKMKFSTRIIIDGKISETDAEHVQKNEIILEELDFGKMMNDEKVLKMMRSSENAQDLDVKSFGNDVPGRKVESKDKITIKFK